MIYLDNAATTRVSEGVFEAMRPYFTENYFNASSTYRPAGLVAGDIEEARKEAATLINARPDEIYFTGGGTESDNWVLKAAAFKFRGKDKHIITSSIEHHAILHTADYLEQLGFEITRLEVDEYGLVDPKALEAAIRPDTFLISIMAANNEIGTIEPVAELGRIAHEHGILFHTDAVQAFGHIPIDVEAMNIDLLSASAHKLNGPKGIGLLYMRKGVRLGSFIHGGSQERGLRASTYNAASIVGFGQAIREAAEHMEERAAYESELRDYMIKRVSEEVPYSRVNGALDKRLPNNVSFCFRFVEGESLLILLDHEEICASSGSACTSGSLDPSHVLLAIGLPHEIAHGSLRLSLSHKTTREEIEKTIEVIKASVERMRSMSPLYEDFVKDQQH